jgi:hypothetical protein
MSNWEIRWSYPAKWMLGAIGWHEAERVDGAVERFADTGAGNVEWMGESRRHMRLYVPPFVLHLELDADEGLLRVWSVSRRAASS